MHNHNILVIDQGTHATRALLFSPGGEILSQAEQAVALQRIDHEQVTQDAEEILASVLQVLVRIGDIPPNTVCALATQRSTIVAWDKTTGAALCPALSWQDRRAQGDLQQFIAHTAQIKSITGLPLSAHYGAGKLRWLLAHNTHVQHAAQQNNVCIGPLASFLLWRLLATHKFCVDASNAHRMMLLDLRSANWDDALLNIFQIDKKYLPECVPIQHPYGLLRDYNLPITTVSGDQTAAFHGLGPLPAGTAVINIGTGAFMLAACDHVITNTPLLCSLRVGGWLLEGTVNGAGSAIDWAQQQWPVERLFEQLPAWLANENTPPVFINTVGGLGSPWWSSASPPCFMEDTGSLPARYVAIIESIVFLLQHNLLSLQQHRVLQTLVISGGLSRLDGLCQKLANLSGCTVRRAEQFETTARGAAWLAAGQPAHWFKPQPGQHFSPVTDKGLHSRFVTFDTALHKLCD